jgi:hypothetical protein
MKTHAISAPTRQGTATITLRVSDGHLTTSTQFTLTVAPPPWLVMLYLAGDDATLDWPTRDLYTRLRAMPYNPAMRLVVLYDVKGTSPGDSRIYVRDPGGLTDLTPALVEPDSPWPFPQDRELNTGRPETLREFLRGSRAMYSGSTYSMLAIVDHGGGWAPDFDLDGPPQPSGGRVQAGGLRGAAIDATDDYTSLSTRDIGEALRDSLGPGQRLDIMFFDACLMGMIEQAYEIRNYADYMVAAENLLFAEYPYDRYLAPANLTVNTSPRDLAIGIVQQYNTRLSGSRNPFTIAAIDLQNVRDASPNGLAAQVNMLAQQILVGLPAQADLNHPLRSALKRAYDGAQKFDYDSSLAIDPTDGYVDLADFARRLRDSTDSAISADVKATAAALFTTIVSQVVVHKRSESGVYESKRNGRQRWDFAGAYGLSIFLPLGEQDWRPTRLNPADPNGPACSEPQLDYYVSGDQLMFAAGVPAWSLLLQRLDATTPIRREPNPCAGQAAAASALPAQPIDRRPFYNPAPVGPVWVMYLPVARK